MSKSNGYQKRNGGRRFDTRLSFADISRLLGLSPEQRIIMRRFIIKRMNGGEQIE